MRWKEGSGKWKEGGCVCSVCCAYLVVAVEVLLRAEEARVRKVDHRIELVEIVLCVWAGRRCV